MTIQLKNGEYIDDVYSIKFHTTTISITLLSLGCRIIDIDEVKEIKS